MLLSRVPLKIVFFRDDGVSAVLESSCIPYTLRFCARRFLVLTKKILIFRGTLYLPFALVAGISPSLVITVVVLSILTEMAGVVSVQVGASRRYDGPMGKSDRAFVFGLLGLLLGLGIDPGWWVNPALGVVAALTAWTVINRVRNGLQELL